MGMAKALVIGSTGTIGSSIVSELQKKGHEVFTISRQSSSDKSKHIYIDFSKPVNFELYNWDFDIAYICFGISGESECKKNLTRSRFVNLYQTKKLIQNLEIHGTRFVYFSSSAVLGGLYRDAQFDSQPTPKGIYAHQKLEIENFILENSKCSNIIRTGKVFGDEFPLIKFWQEQLHQGRKINVSRNKHIAPIESVFLANQLERSIDFKETTISQFSAADDISYAQIASILFTDLNIDEDPDHLINREGFEIVQNQYETLQPSGIFSDLVRQPGRDVLRKFQHLSNL
jgi:dTDP-4-dehydrorhamnose reductase